jgi:transcriptional regulator with PAS, ATPase and Fis domain
MKEAEIQAIKQRFGIVGNAPALHTAIHRAMQVAVTDLTVFISGENGSGKESFSKIIHSISPRREKTFIAINCGAIPSGTIYSELFGHEKGAFTGASNTEARKGYFETADGGTIFLDEIAEMPFETQAMLLRVLENGEFVRMGSSKPLKTNVRVIVATNVDLWEAVQNKKFREDLYFRISTVPIKVPALRERGQDIVLLFRKFTTDFADKYKIEPLRLDEGAKEMLVNFRFPGNIRQLKNLTEQMSLLEGDNRLITADILRQYLPAEQRNQALTLFTENKIAVEQNPTFSEREILYKVLFDMRNEVAELKKLVLQILQSGGQVSAADLIQTHQALFQNLEIEPSEFALAPVPVVQTPMPFVKENLLVMPASTQSNEDEIATIHDILHEEASQSLSLGENERELIIKALKTHKNKRKLAADALGISERTLYRKIKQYDLE